MPNDRTLVPTEAEATASLLTYRLSAGAAGFPVVWSWLQYLGTDHRLAILGTANYQQNIDVDNDRIMAFPFEVAAILLAVAPALWSIQTVVPLGFALTNDPTTGLDMAVMQTNANFGIAPNGVPYFDDTGVDRDDMANLYLDNTGAPYLVKVEGP